MSAFNKPFTDFTNSVIPATLCAPSKKTSGSTSSIRPCQLVWAMALNRTSCVNAKAPCSSRIRIPVMAKDAFIT